MIEAKGDARSHQQDRAEERHRQPGEEYGCEALAQGEPAGEGHEDRRGVGEQRRIGDGGKPDRPVPEAEIGGEQQADEGEPAVIPGGGGLAPRAPGAPVIEAHPQPQERRREQ